MANALPYGQQQRFSVSLTCIGTTLFSAAAETSNTKDFDSIDDLGSTDSTDGIVTEEDFAEDYVAETKPENHSFLASLWARLVRFFNY